MPPTTIPTPGLGTMGITDPDEGPVTIENAIRIGYRHLDTAQKYANEVIVGEGIARTDIPREDLFVATKIEEMNLAYDDVLRTAERSIDSLGIDVVDLLYLHWPAVTGQDDRYDPEGTIRAFNELLDDGRIRNVGVANFSIELVEEAQEHFGLPILANQVEMHPLLQQRGLRTFARKNDMYLVAYCPLMRGSIGEVPELQEIAGKYDATPGQVSLAWLMSKDRVVPIPKSGGTHLQENYRARDLDLHPSDLDQIDAIDREERVVDPGKGPWNW